MTEKFFIETLGCPKNIVDSENIILSLEKTKLLKRIHNINKADIIIINTCCFIQPATEESIEAILKLSEFKKKKCQLLIVCGCLVSRYFKNLKELKNQFPQVDLWISLNQYSNLPQKIIPSFEKFGRKVKVSSKPFNDVNRSHVLLTPSSWAYLKIADGCSRNCSFCIIPKIKGPYISREIKSVVNEAKRLADRGVKELILISQDITSYGIDLYKKKKLVLLLNQLCQIKNLEWIRLMYLNPDGITDELVDIIASQDKICKYLDIPLQHCQKNILRRMGRTGNYQSLINLIQKIRKKIKDVAIRTTFMVGFPGETKEDFNSLLDFLKELKFDRVGAFTYFPEEETRACKFNNQIPLKIKQFRYNKLLSTQKKISLKINSELVGKVFKVLIEEKIIPSGLPCTKTPRMVLFKYLGRTFKDAPEIDGLFFITRGKAKKGSLITARVTDFTHYDLIGEIIN